MKVEFSIPDAHECDVTTSPGQPERYLVQCPVCGYKAAVEFYPFSIKVTNPGDCDPATPHIYSIVQARPGVGYDNEAIKN